MATVRITEADLIRDVEGALAKVRQGDEVVVQNEGRDVAVMKPPAGRPRTISETLAVLESLGGLPVPDADFWKDVGEGIKMNDVPWEPPEWD